MADLSYRFTGVNTAQLENEVRLLRQNSSTFRAMEAAAAARGYKTIEVQMGAGLLPGDVADSYDPNSSIWRIRINSDATGTGGVLGNYMDPSLIAPAQGALPAGPVSSGPIARDLSSDETAGSNPVGYVSGRIMGQPQGAQAAPPSPERSGPPVGIFSGQPMLPFPLPPSFWSRRDDTRAPDDDEEERSSRWLRLLSPQ